MNSANTPPTVYSCLRPCRVGRITALANRRASHTHRGRQYDVWLWWGSTRHRLNNLLSYNVTRSEHSYFKRQHG